MVFMSGYKYLAAVSSTRKDAVTNLRVGAEKGPVPGTKNKKVAVPATNNQKRKRKKGPRRSKKNCNWGNLCAKEDCRFCHPMAMARFEYQASLSKGELRRLRRELRSKLFPVPREVQEKAEESREQNNKLNNMVTSRPKALPLAAATVEKEEQCTPGLSYGVTDHDFLTKCFMSPAVPEMRNCPIADDQLAPMIKENEDHVEDLAPWQVDEGWAAAAASPSEVDEASDATSMMSLQTKTTTGVPTYLSALTSTATEAAPSTAARSATGESASVVSATAAGSYAAAAKTDKGVREVKKRKYKVTSEDITERNTTLYFWNMMIKEYESFINDFGVQAERAVPCVLSTESLKKAIQKACWDQDRAKRAWVCNTKRARVALRKNVKYTRWCTNCNNDFGCDCNPKKFKEKRRKKHLDQIAKDYKFDTPRLDLQIPHYLVPDKTALMKLETPAQVERALQKLDGYEHLDEETGMRWKFHFGRPSGKQQQLTIYFDVAKQHRRNMVPLNGFQCQCGRGNLKSVDYYINHVMTKHKRCINAEEYNNFGEYSKPGNYVVKENKLTQKAGSKKLAAKWGNGIPGLNRAKKAWKGKRMKQAEAEYLEQPGEEVVAELHSVVPALDVSPEEEALKEEVERHALKGYNYANRRQQEAHKKAEEVLANCALPSAPGLMKGLDPYVDEWIAANKEYQWRNVFSKVTTLYMKRYCVHSRISNRNWMPIMTEEEEKELTRYVPSEVEPTVDSPPAPVAAAAVKEEAPVEEREEVSTPVPLAKSPNTVMAQLGWSPHVKVKKEVVKEEESEEEETPSVSEELEVKEADVEDGQSWSDDAEAHDQTAESSSDDSSSESSPSSSEAKAPEKTQTNASSSEEWGILPSQMKQLNFDPEPQTWKYCEKCECYDCDCSSEEPEPVYDPNSMEQQTESVELRIRQYRGRKYIMTMFGLAPDIDQKKLLSHFQKKYATNGTFKREKCMDKWCKKRDPKTHRKRVCKCTLRQYIQIQGDQRENMSNFLVDSGIVTKDMINVHGF